MMYHAVVPGSHIAISSNIRLTETLHWNTTEIWSKTETAESFTRLVYLCLVFQHSEHHESILTVLDILLTPSSIVV